MSVVAQEPAGAAALPALFLASALAGAAIGLFNPLIAAQMAQAGYGEVVIGASSTLFFLCVMLAAPIAERLIRRCGVRGVMLAGIPLTACAAAPFPWTQDLVLWSVLRVLMGIGVGLYMIGGQSALNALARERNRALVSGMYALAFGLGLSIGPLVGAQLYGIAPELAFGAGAVLLLAGLPWLLAVLPAARVASGGPRLALFGELSLPLHGVFAYGVAEATLMSMYPVYLLQRGFSVGELSAAFSAFVVGGLISTVPVTHLADRYGRERVLLCCALIGVTSTVGLVSFSSPVWVACCAVLAGASLGPVFALTLALVGASLSRERLSAGSALFTAAFSLGAMIAPLASGLMMEQLGPQHVFSLTVLLFVSLLFRLLGRARAAQWAAS